MGKVQVHGTKFNIRRLQLGMEYAVPDDGLICLGSVEREVQRCLQSLDSLHELAFHSGYPGSQDTNRLCFCGSHDDCILFQGIGCSCAHGFLGPIYDVYHLSQIRGLRNFHLGSSIMTPNYTKALEAALKEKVCTSKPKEQGSIMTGKQYLKDLVRRAEEILLRLD